MTTLYRPVRIETAEQAEAMPIGAISVDADAPGLVPAEVSTKQEDGLWYGQITARSTNAEMVGEFALVPTEAEEEWSRERPGVCTPACPFGAHDHLARRRIVTPWEEA